eukprot:4050986-Lingulodinium_polyedra.AAC.1
MTLSALRAHSRACTSSGSGAERALRAPVLRLCFFPWVWAANWAWCASQGWHAGQNTGQSMGA